MLFVTTHLSKTQYYYHRRSHPECLEGLRIYGYQDRTHKTRNEVMMTMTRMMASSASDKSGVEQQLR